MSSTRALRVRAEGIGYCYESCHLPAVQSSSVEEEYSEERNALLRSEAAAMEGEKVGARYFVELKTGLRGGRISY